MTRGTWRAHGALIATAAACALCSGAATAQQATLPAIIPGERLQSVEFDVNTTYDTNAASSDAAVANLRGIKQSDEIIEPSARFDVARPFGRETVYLQGSAGYDFHLANTILNRENIDLHPGVLATIGPCQTTLGGQYSRSQSSLAETALSTPGLPIFENVDNVITVEQVAFSGSCGRSTGLAPTASVSQTWLRNSLPLEKFTDADTFSTSAGLAYRRPSFGSLNLFGAFSETNYSSRAALVALIPGISSGYQTYSGGVTYQRQVGARLQGTASISYTVLKSFGGGRGFAGLTYSAGLNYRISSRLQATLSASRATVPSNRLNSNFGIDDFVSAELDDRVGSRITLRTGASYGEITYDGIPYPVGIDLTDQKIATAFAGGDLQLTRRLSLGLNVAHSQTDANYPGLSYPDTRVTLSFRVRL